MKVLHIAPVKLIPSSSGNPELATEGISHSVTSLISAQSFNCIEVGLISSYTCDSVSLGGIYCQSLEKIKLKNLISKKIITKYLLDFGLPDLVHVHDIFNLKQLLIIFNLLNLGVLVYISPRGSFSPVALKRNRNKKLLIRLFLNIFTFDRLKAFIALNEGEKKHIEALYPKKNVIIAHNGTHNNFLKHHFYRHNFRTKYNSNEVNIGFIGRFDIHIKGLDILLNAYLKYQKYTNNINIKLTLIGSHRIKGENDSASFFQDIITKLPDPSKISILGPILGEEKWNELTKFDILIQPSRTEGMPMTVLEAISIGVPCIVSKETNMEEIINESKSGWVINAIENDLFEIFKKIKNINKIKLAKMGLNGMRYSKKKLNWNEVSKINYL